MKKLLLKVADQFKETAVLLHSTPALVMCFFVISVVGMNLLANKSINLGLDWLALDVGFILSWGAFMAMDILVKLLGPRASIRLTIVTLLINLLVALFFFIGSKIPGVWGESFVEGSEAVINKALDNTFGGTWYIILGSSAAFIVSGIANIMMNFGIGKLFKKNPNSFLAFASRSYISTMIGQFIDNIIFALLVSRIFFGWSLVQCVTCAATGAIAELLMEIIFSPLGYKVSERLRQNGCGEPYFAYLREKGIQVQ